MELKKKKEKKKNYKRLRNKVHCNDSTFLCKMHKNIEMKRNEVNSTSSSLCIL